VPVSPGRSANLVTTTGAFRRDRPHLVVGAHLDTVPQAPGAEDNASGVGVLLAVAEALSGARTRLPVVLVAFGAEEPRGPTDEDHHYGSRHYVATLSAEQRRGMRAMVSLDRVGVGRVLPICGATSGNDRLEDALLRAAARARVPAVRCDLNRSSDHWSFVRAGLPGVRLGSTPYAGYHSRADVPSVVGRRQLARTGRTVLSWLNGP
jgi:Zn-dependent M28 family amino/carboxypeptidase